MLISPFHCLRKGGQLIKLGATPDLFGVRRCYRSDEFERNELMVRINRTQRKRTRKNRGNNRSFIGSVLLLVTASCLIATFSMAAQAAVLKDLNNSAPAVGQKFQAVDSLDTSLKSGKSDQAVKKYLDGLAWPKQRFEVELLSPYKNRGDFMVTFPSPVKSNNGGDDTVTMEWYAARNEAGEMIKAPAIVVVHESGSGMTVGQIFAKTLKKQHFHTFLLHMPGYGKRKAKQRQDVSELVTLFHQAISDVRRARDAVAALPMVDERLIVLQGTSLGGFVSATVAGLDDGYDGVFLMLAGGDLYDILMHGKRDAEKVLEKTREAGIDDDQLKKIIDKIEPLNFASRMNASHVWLYSGKYDTVVPLKNALLLARTAGLAREHHILMPVNHYSGIVYLPVIFKHIGEKIHLIAESKGIEIAM